LFAYAAHGLSIRSELRIPGLRAEPDSFSPPPDSAGSQLTIRVEPRRGPPSTAGFDVDIRPDVVEFDHFEFGRVTVRGGREIVVRPHERADEAALELFVAGPALAVALHQRGGLVLHATAVAIGDRALAILGEKGAGKSTLAAALTRRGHRLLSDDVVVIAERDGRPVALAGTATLKIQPEAAQALGVDPSRLALLHPNAEKRSWPGAADDRAPPPSTPLATLLVAAPGPGPSIAPLDGPATFLELVRHTYGARYDYMQRSGGSARHFAQVAALVLAVRAFRLVRGDDLARLAETAERVETLVS
jgi:hypothetical protein